MNTIPLPQLVELLALATNTSEETARAFLTSLWDVIGQALADGRQARIKGIGTFALGGLSGDQLQFVPDEGLAEAVNSSFSFFEPMELGDGIDETMLEEVEEETSAEPGRTPTPVEAAEESDGRPRPAPLRHPPTPVEAAEESDGRPRPAPLRRPHPLIPLGVGLVAGFALGFFIPWRGEGSSQEVMPAVPVDSIEVVEEEVGDTTWVTPASIMEDSIEIMEEVVEAPKVVYDTIGQRRFLTTMSRKYYGRYEFWPYIYEENKDKLGHPDRIAPGTVVVIPPAEKYGIDADDPESLKAASRKIAEIYARF